MHIVDCLTDGKMQKSNAILWLLAFESDRCNTTVDILSNLPPESLIRLWNHLRISTKRHYWGLDGIKELQVQFDQNNKCFPWQPDVLEHLMPTLQHELL